ncbi:MerR family transcriptional regulator [Variovorax sp. HJSM1_2]|uniref:MerR family transcriptional regulator n=1 Tax=Variovorax sp. HJSM1_2 TaxID=3366263 RepID=UPI003BD80E9C
MGNFLPPIPAKRYFTIGEVGDLCGVKPHVLRYWEQEFAQLRPMKRRGNRRYYQHHEVLMIRRIRDLLYDQGFTISGARNKLQEFVQDERERRRVEDEVELVEDTEFLEEDEVSMGDMAASESMLAMQKAIEAGDDPMPWIRRELAEIRALLAEDY